jgi:hypothetical protein
MHTAFGSANNDFLRCPERDSLFFKKNSLGVPFDPVWPAVGNRAIASRTIPSIRCGCGQVLIEQGLGSDSVEVQVHLPRAPPCAPLHPTPSGSAFLLGWGSVPSCHMAHCACDFGIKHSGQRKCLSLGILPAAYCQDRQSPAVRVSRVEVPSDPSGTPVRDLGLRVSPKP